MKGLKILSNFKEICPLFMSVCTGTEFEIPYDTTVLG